MRFRLALVAVAVCLHAAPGADAAFAASAGECRQAALAQLRASSPDGFAISRQTGDPSFFASWIDCDDPQFDLSTAVHESTHLVTAETDAFPLVGGGAVARPHEVSGFFPPYKIAARFQADDFTSIYLRQGRASSSTDFLYLLDEFAAYTHDLAVAVDLRHLSSPDLAVDHRDGLAAMMAFVAAYADAAETGEPETWLGLRAPSVRATIATLWTRAERVMASSCGIPHFGTRDRIYLEQVCAAGRQSAMARILGRAVECSAACLKPVPEAEDPATDGDLDQAPPRYAARTVETQLAGDVTAGRPRHPFAGNAGPRRHPLHDEDR